MTNISWQECLNEIWEVSKCNRVVSDYRRRLLFKDIRGADFSESYIDMLKDCETNLLPLLQKNKEVYVHEEYRIKKGIYGELDIRSGNDIIIEIKTTINEDVNMEWILQLLCYKILVEWNNNTVKINEITIFNPLKGLFFSFDVSSWNKHTDLVQYLLEKRERAIKNNQPI
jgi:CRISPR/Cas system-associated exonuclease Cas4 (RecB family)